MTAGALPSGDASLDAVVCECAFCTLPDKGTAAAELARVLQGGGRVGVTDVWLDAGRLDADLVGLAGHVACLADARPISGLPAILESPGVVVDLVERYDEALPETIEQVEVRLRALRLLDLPMLRPFNSPEGSTSPAAPRRSSSGSRRLRPHAASDDARRSGFHEIVTTPATAASRMSRPGARKVTGSVQGAGRQPSLTEAEKSGRVREWS